jgi:hypothetical protein
MSYGRAATATVTVAVVLLCAIRSDAEDDSAPQPSSAGTQEQTGEEVETLKERLSDKASDEQRVDNCKVAPDRRGTKARPEACAGDGSKEPPSQPSQ